MGAHLLVLRVNSYFCSQGSLLVCSEDHLLFWVLTGPANMQGKGFNTCTISLIFLNPNKNLNHYYASALYYFLFSIVFIICDIYFASSLFIVHWILLHMRIEDIKVMYILFYLLIYLSAKTSIWHIQMCNKCLLMNE